jgi:hypothetical protein
LLSEGRPTRPSFVPIELRASKTGSVWAAASASEYGKGVITTQEEPEVREHIRAGPGS